MWPFEIFSGPCGIKSEMRARRFHGSCHGGRGTLPQRLVGLQFGLKILKIFKDLQPAGTRMRP